MWKSIVIMILAVPLSIIAGIIFWASNNWRAGVVAGCSTFALCLVAATVMLFFIKKLSLADVFLPVIFSVGWSFILIPFSFGTEVFTAPAAIGSGFLLTLCLWRFYHNNEIGKYWLIFPVMVYIYEMLPVNIPGPFDDYFCFGGDVASTILFFAVTSSHKELSASGRR